MTDTLSHESDCICVGHSCRRGRHKSDRLLARVRIVLSFCLFRYLRQVARTRDLALFFGCSEKWACQSLIAGSLVIACLCLLMRTQRRSRTRASGAKLISENSALPPLSRWDGK